MRWSEPRDLRERIVERLDDALLFLWRLGWKVTCRLGWHEWILLGYEVGGFVHLFGCDDDASNGIFRVTEIVEGGFRYVNVRGETCTAHVETRCCRCGRVGRS